MRKLRNDELGRVSKETFKTIRKMPVIVVLDNLRSHLNVGSIFRSCDAFPVEALYLCGITGAPPHRDIQKTALGATETVSWRHFHRSSDAIDELKQQGYKIVSIEQVEGAWPLQHIHQLLSFRLALVLGNEVEGVHQNIVLQSDYCIEIPQHGSKHSLNVAVSAGVVLWEIAKHFYHPTTC
jgi:tRNA G18 (ribose-2'-O)-methylase SpoU